MERILDLMGERFLETAAGVGGRGGAIDRWVDGS